MGHYMSDQEVKILRKWIKKQMQRMPREISFSQSFNPKSNLFEDDDMLMKAESVPELKMMNSLEP